MTQRLDHEADLESENENIQWWLILVCCLAGAGFLLFVSISDSILLMQGTHEIGKVTSVYVDYKDASHQIEVTRENGEIVRASTFIPIFGSRAFSAGQSLGLKCREKRCALEHPFFLRITLSLLAFFVGGALFSCAEIWNLAHRVTAISAVLFYASAFMLIRAVWSLIFYR